MKTTLSRIDRPKTQQAGVLIYGLGSRTDESGSENQFSEGALVKEIQKFSHERGDRSDSGLNDLNSGAPWMVATVVTEKS